MALASGVDIDRAAWGEPQPKRALDTYLRAVGAHRLLVAAVAAATLLASGVWLAQRSPQYRATAQLLINPLSQFDDTYLGLPMIKDSGDPTRTIQTAAGLLESPAAARAAAQRLGGDWTGQRVLDHIDIEPEGESNILDVSARAGSGTEAERVANEFAAATLRERDTALRRATAPVIDRLNRVRSRLPRGDPSAADLDERIARLEDVSVGGDPTVELSRDATSSSSAQGAPSWLVIVLALGAGVILGSVAALLTERLSAPTIRAEDELGEVDPTPVLARVPDVSVTQPKPRPPFPFQAPLPVLASFHSVELQLRAQEGEHRTILFTSTSPGDGTTTSVINFALALASAEQRVIVFDLDLREPDLARTLGVAQDRNLLSALPSRAGLGEVLAFVPGVPMIKVVPGISDVGGRTLEHVGRGLPDLIAEARSMASYVLLDTSSLGAFGDALRFVDAVDDIVLVARLNHTRVADVEMVRELLRRAGKPATGYILLERRVAPVRTVRDLLRGAVDSAASILRGARAVRPSERRGRPRPERPSAPTQPVPERPPPRGAAAARMAAATTSLTELVSAGVLSSGAELVATAHGREYTARVRGDYIEVNGTRYTSLSAAAASITGKQTNGWTFWHARVNGDNVSLAQLRADLRRRG